MVDEWIKNVMRWSGEESEQLCEVVFFVDDGQIQYIWIQKNIINHKEHYRHSPHSISSRYFNLFLTRFTSNIKHKIFFFINTKTHNTPITTTYPRSAFLCDLVNISWPSQPGHLPQKIDKNQRWQFVWTINSRWIHTNTTSTNTLASNVKTSISHVLIPQVILSLLTTIMIMMTFWRGLTHISLSNVLPHLCPQLLFLVKPLINLDVHLCR